MVSVSRASAAWEHVSISDTCHDLAGRDPAVVLPQQHTTLSPTSDSVERTRGATTAASKASQNDPMFFTKDSSSQL